MLRSGPVARAGRKKPAARKEARKPADRANTNPKIFLASEEILYPRGVRKADIARGGKARFEVNECRWRFFASYLPALKNESERYPNTSRVHGPETE